MDIKEDTLPELVIDLGMARTQQLNEDILGQFGATVGLLMRAIFGGHDIPVSIRGTKSEVSAFSNVLAKEKKYLENYNKFGLNNPSTFKSKYKLDKAVKGFEGATGLKWPFK
tara:strand:+ start:153 stop:488 length:336 start_codon:yes stop_codon:yes gene_type:complete